MALNLFAAAVALIVRLSEGSPARLAEEIIAVNLIEEAGGRLESLETEAQLAHADVSSAAGELRGLFELFQDDDVRDMFDMHEPADAALAGHDPIKRQMGVVDQRVESSFRPFGWTIPTGYLGDDESPNAQAAR